MSLKFSYPYAGPLTAVAMSALGRQVRPTGIYSGGVLTFSGSTLTVSPCQFEIASSGSSTDQMSCEDTAAATLSSLTQNTTLAVVFRWLRTTSAETDLPVLQAVATASVVASDVVVGRVVTGSAGAISSVNYIGRTQAASRQIEFAVQAFDSADFGRKVFVSGGRTNVAGVSTYSAPTTVSLDSNSTLSTRLDLIYVDSSGIVQVARGTNNNTLPTVSGAVPLAQVSLAQNYTQVAATSLTDLRAAQASPPVVSASFGTSGYAYVGSGLIVQWGYQVGVSGVSPRVVFPMTFPNALLGITLGDQCEASHGGSGVSAGIYYGSGAPNTSGFYLSNQNGLKTFWVAIGY